MTSAVRLVRDIPIVLVIDADLNTQSSLAASLEPENYQVVMTQSGADGLELYNRLQPDIVLLGGLLTDMEGLHCCTQLAARDDSTYVSVLVITDLNDQQSIDKAFEAGAEDYIYKPIHWPVLRHRLKRLLSSNRTLMQLEMANQELARLATQDGLTFVANRRCFDVTLSQEWQRLAREQAAISLLLCDIDFFKSYNDTYGHQAGDRCLKQVAHLISKSARRPADLVARYGGEEFAILLPNTDIAGACRVGDCVQEHLYLAAIAHSTSPVSSYVTISIGVASCIPEPNSLPESFVHNADKALYQAKEQGRNRVQPWVS